MTHQHADESLKRSKSVHALIIAQPREFEAAASDLLRAGGFAKIPVADRGANARAFSRLYEDLAEGKGRTRTDWPWAARTLLVFWRFHDERAASSPLFKGFPPFGVALRDALQMFEDRGLIDADTVARTVDRALRIAASRGLVRTESPVVKKVASLNDDEWLYASDIALAAGVSPEPLRKRLERYRVKHQQGWKEVQGKEHRQSGYLYQVRAIRHLIRPTDASARPSE